MRSLSITRETLDSLFSAEGLAPPSVVPWPMESDAEEDRKRREERFSGGAGSHPPAGMEWMASHAPVKYRPDRVLEGCRSVLVTSLRYYRDNDVDGGGPVPERAVGRIARFARGRDYHKELGGRLKRIIRRLAELSPSDGFRSFVDIGPLDEVWLAEASGAGFRGRHGLLIFPDEGSWSVLGHIVTTHPFVPSPPKSDPLSCPSGCRRCIDACPASALAMPGVIDASRCLSSLTIEFKGPWPGDLASAAGDRVFGCDACQEACPFNVPAVPTETPAFAKDIAGPSVPLAELLALRNREDATSRFAGSSLMRAGRAGLVRNACIAAGNLAERGESGANSAMRRSELTDIARLLEELVDDEDEGVRVHARTALEKLGFRRNYPGADSNG